MPKVVSLKLKELRKRGYNDVSEWLADPKHLYIGRQMNISIYTNYRSLEPPGTEVGIDANGTKVLFRPYTMKNVPFEARLLSYPIGSYVDNKGKIVHLCHIPQSKWHNPFKVKHFNSRGQVVNEFEAHLLGNKALINSLSELSKYTEIGCWCKPKACHGDIISKHYFKNQFRQKNVKTNSNTIPTKIPQKIPQKIIHQSNDNKNEEEIWNVWDMKPSQTTNIASKGTNDFNKISAPKSARRMRMNKQKQKQNDIECKQQSASVISLSMGCISEMSVESALCIIPPQSTWNTIQSIRKHHDPGYYRWMPHINILFPFIDERHFGQISKYISNRIIQQNNIKSFDVHLNGFDIFDRTKKSQKLNAWIMNNELKKEDNLETLFLRPSGSECHHTLQKLFKLLKKDWKELANKHGGQFRPHLTVGNFKKNQINQYKQHFQSMWKPISFRCDAIYLISRKGNVAFQIRHKIPLC